MAFISLGSKSFGSSPTITAKFSYEKRRDGADMEYRVKIILSPLTGPHHYGYPISAKVSLAGSLKVTKQLKAASPSQWSSNIEYTTSWYTVSKKTTGTTSLSIRLYATGGGTRDSTYNFSLAIDPAASVLGSISNFTIGNAINIPITKYSSGFKDSLTISVAGTTIKTINNISNGYDVSFSSTELTNIYKKIPSSTTATFTFKLTTKSGSTTVGTSTKTATGTIPSSVKPSISGVTISEAGSIPSGWGIYVKNKSKLKFVISASAGSGSSISSIKTVINGGTYTGTTITTNTITASGNLTATITVTDKRNRTASTTKTVSIVDYAVPYVTSLNAFRCNSDGTANDKGTYMKIELVGGVTSLNGKNTYAYKIQYKKSTESTYQTINITNQDTTIDYTTIVSAESASSYNVQAVLADYFTSITISTQPVSSVFRTINFKAGGRGVAFGKIAEKDNTVDFGMSLYCNDNTNGTQISRIGTSTSWIYGRDKAIFKQSTLNGYSPFASVKTKNGSWDIGAYDHSTYQDQLILSYITDSNYNNDSNNVTRQIRFNPNNGLIMGALVQPPVNSIIITATNSNPSSIYGGTWSLIDKGFSAKYATSGGFKLNTTNASEHSCYWYRGGHTITFELRVKPKVAINDRTIALGNIDTAALGITRMGGTQRLTALCDGGQNVVMIYITTDGELRTCDIIPESSMAAGNPIEVTFTETFQPNYMLDSACDKFYWKRTA